MFPRILAIERNDNRMIGRVRIAVRKLGHFVYEVVGCIIAVPRRIGEANQIREGVVTEEGAQ